MRGEQDIHNALRQNLADAGCDNEMCRQCMSLLGREKKQAVMEILALHRKTLLEKLRQNQRQIDVLDYLIEDLKTNNYIQR